MLMMEHVITQSSVICRKRESQREACVGAGRVPRTRWQPQLSYRSQRANVTRNSRIPVKPLVLNYD